jgi:hypothetical protein
MHPTPPRRPDRPHRPAAGRGPRRPDRRPHRAGPGYRRPGLCGQLRSHQSVRGRDCGLPARVGLVGTAAGRQLHHRGQPGHPLAVSARRGWRAPWYAWTLVGCATAVSVALNVAHAPDRISAQLFAALPLVALLGALELLMSVARTGLPHTSHTTIGERRRGPRGQCGPSRAATASRTRPQPQRGQRQRPAARQSRPGPGASRPRARHQHPTARPRGCGRGRDQRTPRL